MEAISVDNIEQAIKEFYHTSDGREKAHKWLSSIQNSPTAWQFCWLLISKDKGVEVQFFGATTLQHKILKHWYEVPSESVAELQSKVMERVLLFGSSSADRMIANKLCLAMSSLILHTLDEEWPAAITEVISTFHNCTSIPQEVRCRLLLDILTGLPDQFSAADFGVQRGRKSAVQNKLKEEFDQIHSLLSSLLEQNAPSVVKDSALRCMSSWIEFGICIDRMGELVSKAFACLHHSELFESAVDTLIAVLTKNQPSRFPNTLQNYFAEIIKLLPLWTAAVQNEEERDWCRDISRLVVNSAEENVDVLIQYSSGNEEQQKICMGVIHMILALTDVKGNFPHDETLSDLPFGFWYILQDAILASTQDHYDYYMTVFTPVYMTLVHILVRKVQYPEEDVYRSLNSEEREQFRCYRQDISDTVMYATCLLREHLLSMLIVYIDTLMQSLPNVRWQDVESVLYILTNVPDDSIATTDEEWDDNDVLPNRVSSSLFLEMAERLVNLISKLQMDNSILLIAVLQCLGAFAEHYSNRPQLLTVVFPVILLNGLNRSNTVLYATRALKDICRENMEVLPNYAEGILEICHTKVLGGQMEARNAARLLSCVGYVLSGLSNDQIAQWLNKLLPPITEALREAASATPTVSVKGIILDKLQMLTWLFDSLDPKRPDCKPVLVIMKELIPLLHSVLSNWAADNDVVECVVDLLKRSLQSLLDDFKPILEDVCSLLVKIYEFVQHSAVLDIVRQLVLTFKKENITYDLVKTTLHSVSHKTLHVLKQDARSNTDLLESYMNLCCQLSKKASRLLAEENFPFEASMEIAIVGVSFPEAPTMKASCSFLTDVLSKREQYSKLDAVVQRIAAPMYDIMLKSIGGASPRANVENTTGIFLAMNVAHFEVATSVMNILLSKENYPAPQATPDVKQRFLKDVLKERSSKRRLKDTITNFSMVCRGIMGTEYAQQTALSMQYR